MIRRPLNPRLVSAVLSAWILAGVAGALHHHAPNLPAGGHGPCTVCVSASAPALAIAHQTLRVEEPTVAAIVIDVRTLLPEDAFFDHPLARGPPARS